MWPIPAPTRIIRTPAAGPEPANTLVFLRCSVPYVPGDPQEGHAWRGPFDFQTEFRLDGYLQRDYDWHLANMLVSATGEIEIMGASTDLNFAVGVESVAPRLNQTDGVLGFSCGMYGKAQDDAIFSQGSVSVLIAISAWVLCFEPRAPTPPLGGDQRTPWAAAPLRNARRGWTSAPAGGARAVADGPRRTPCAPDGPESGGR